MLFPPRIIVFFELALYILIFKHTLAANTCLTYEDETTVYLM